MEGYHAVLIEFNLKFQSVLSTLETIKFFTLLDIETYKIITMRIFSSNCSMPGYISSILPSLLLHLLRKS